MGGVPNFRNEQFEFRKWWLELHLMPVEDSVAPLGDEIVVFAGSLFAVNLMFCLRVGCLLCLGELPCSQFPTIIEWYGKISPQASHFLSKNTSSNNLASPKRASNMASRLWSPTDGSSRLNPPNSPSWTSKTRRKLLVVQ